MMRRLYILLDDFEDRPVAPYVGVAVLVASFALIMTLPGLAVKP